VPRVSQLPTQILDPEVPFEDAFFDFPLMTERGYAYLRDPATVQTCPSVGADYRLI
jgi:hypothetical protein